MTSSIYLELLLHRKKIVSLDFELTRFDSKVLILQIPDDTEGRLSMRSVRFHFGRQSFYSFGLSLSSIFYIFVSSFFIRQTVQTVT